MTRILIGLGVLLIVLGLLWPVVTRLGIGRLPGDFMFRRGGFTFYLPLATCLLVSAVASLILWLFRR